MKLMELYNYMHNPIEDPKVMEKLINAYANANNSNEFGGFYGQLTKTVEKQHTEGSHYTVDADRFYSMMFNKWKNSIISLTIEQITNVSVPNFDMVRSFKNLASKDLNKYSAIFIGGGNTYKLLKGLKESSSFDKIQEYIQSNGILVGCSAGAVICGKDIDIVASMDPNDVKLIDTKGFDVLSGISVFPHYINLKSNLSDEENQAIIDKYTDSIIDFTLKNGDVYAIPEEDTIFVNNGSIDILGNRPYYYFKDGKRIRYNIN